MTNSKSVVANSQIEALSTNLKETRVSHFFFVITPDNANDISFVIGMAAFWLLGKVQDLKFAIQDLVYG